MPMLGLLGHLQGGAAAFAIDFIKAAPRAAPARLRPSASGSGPAGGPPRGNFQFGRLPLKQSCTHAK